MWAAALADDADELLKSIGWNSLSPAFYDEYGTYDVCTLCRICLYVVLYVVTKLFLIYLFVKNADWV